MPIDFGPTASDYTQHRRPFPAELLRRLSYVGVGRKNQHILDVGSGTGLLATPLAEAGAIVTMLDVSHDLLRQAGRTGQTALITGRVESLPFADRQFDAVTAAQCWHWFDRRLAPREIHRVLKPGGMLAVVYQMHVPLPESVAEATERLILEYHPKWRHANSAGINGQVLRDMQSAGYSGIESFSFDTLEAFSAAQWRGLIRTTSAVGASLAQEQVAAFDADHAAMLDKWPSPLQIPFRVFTAIARRTADEL